MTTLPLPPMAIVAAVDDTPESGVAIREALRKGVAMGDANVHVVHVLDSGAEPDAEALDRAGRSLLGRITEAGAALRPSPPDMDVHVHVRTGDPASQILDIARSRDAELVVLGPPHGRRLGSVARTVLEQADAQVLVARPFEASVEQRRDDAREGEAHTYETTHRIQFLKPPADTTAPAGQRNPNPGHASMGVS